MNYQFNDIASCQGENIRAGDPVPAPGDGVDCGFGLDHGVESISGEGEVIGVILLRLVAWSRRHDHRGIAALQQME